MKKSTKIVSLFSVIIFSMLFVSSYSVSPTIPTSVSLLCGESYNQEFIISPESGETISITPMVISDDGTQMALTHNPVTNHLIVSIFHTSGCTIGDKGFSFKINNDTYNIGVNISSELFELDTITLSEDTFVDVGGVVDFHVQTTGNDRITYSIQCSSETPEESFLNKDESLETSCGGDNFKFTLDNSFEDLGAAIITIYSSESGYALTKMDDEEEDESECVLGLDTFGALVKRGNIFAIKTININDNSYIPGVIVTILDQTGDLSAISGESSSVGFFSQRLHEDYEADLVVQLEKEGCEPYTNVILFENSYSDYIEEIEDEQLAKTLDILIDEDITLGEEYTGSVINLKEETIEEATIKITKPDDTTLELTTSESGDFQFTPEDKGTWKIQVTKTNYESSELIEFEVVGGEYNIVALVNGARQSTFVKGDEIVFELRDEDTSDIVSLNVVATYGDDEVEFINGVSDEVDFTKDFKLEIPEISGYEDQTFSTKVKSNKNVTYWVIGVIVVFFLFIVLAGKFSKKPTKTGKMEVQLNPHGN